MPTLCPDGTPYDEKTDPERLQAQTVQTPQIQPQPQPPGNDGRQAAELTADQYEQGVRSIQEDLERRYHPRLVKRHIPAIRETYERTNAQVRAGRLKVTQAEVDALRTVVFSKAEADSYQWRANNDGNGLTRREQERIAQLKMEWETAMDRMMKGSPAAKAIHDAYHEASQRGDPTGGGLWGDRGTDGRHNDNYIRSNPKSPFPLLFDGRHKLANGDPSGAAERATQALSMDPRSVEAYNLRAMANVQMKNLANAAEDARAALRLEPGNVAAQQILAMSEGRGASFAAGAAPSALAAGFSGGEGSGGVATRVANASLYTMTPQAQAAAGFLKRGYDAARFGDYAAAADYAGRALQADPNSLVAYLARAMAYNKLKDYDRAYKDAVAGLKLDSKNAALLAQKALAANNIKDFRSALEAANAALEVNPKDALAYEQRAFALAGLGDRAGALEALRQAAVLNPIYQGALDRALQAPTADDLLLLFQQDRLAGGPATGGAPLPRGKRFGLVAVASVVGGVLLGLGLLRLFLDPLKRGLQTVFTRVTGGSARVVLSAPPLAEREPGLLRGQYRILRQIGMGGMGMVYEGCDVSLARRVAIKKMRDEIKLDGAQKKRFLSEAKTVAALHHPNIVDIYSIIEEDGDAYLVFEFVAGRTVHEIVHGRGRLGFAESMAILRGVAAALDYAHGKGVIHRDLKPSNIMLDEDGRAKVMDFGIARLAKDAMNRLSMTNTIVGTPPYMAPEQEQGSVRRESDVYALGVCLYEMLTGRLPFLGSNGAMLMSKLEKAYQPASTLAPGLPAGLDDALARALEPDPDKRLKSAGEFVTRLDALSTARTA